MKKSIIATLAAAMMATTALGLAACSKKDGGTTDTPPETPAATTYTVTFNANGGSVTPASAKTGTDGKLTSLPTPTKTDNKFEGWYTAASAGTKIELTKVYDKDTTIYAHWTPNAVVPPVTDTTYTITFNANGGEVTPASAKTGTDGKLTSLPTPTKGTDTFNGWYTAATGGDKVELTKTYDADTTIYAQWTADTPVVAENAVLVGGKVLVALEDNTASIADPEDPKTQGKPDREYMIQGVTLKADDVVTIQIDNEVLTHAAQTLELWSADCHGVKFDQAAGTFTVRAGEDREFDIYVRHFTEAERQKSNSNDKGDCWSVQITDGLSDAADTRVAIAKDAKGVWLVGKLFGDTGFQWDKGLVMTQSGTNYSITLDLEAGHVFKVRQDGTGHGYNILLNATSEAYVNDVGGNDHNMEVKEDGNYTITFDGANYKISIVKNS